MQDVLHQDWKNHLHATHGQCLEDDDPLDQEEYAAGFKLDRWERFHDIKGDETDRAYLRIATLRKHYGRYQGQVQGKPRGPPSTIRLPHIKGTTTDRDVTPTESEWAGSEQEGSGQEEGEITQTEGDEPGSFTQMRSKDSDSGSDDATTGRDSWPPPPSVSPRRSPRLTKSAVRDLRSLPLTTKSDRRTAHSRSVSGDEHGRGPSHSSRSSSDHGRSSQGRRSTSR